MRNLNAGDRWQRSNAFAQKRATDVTNPDRCSTVFESRRAGHGCSCVRTVCKRSNRATRPISTVGLGRAVKGTEEGLGLVEVSRKV